VALRRQPEYACRECLLRFIRFSLPADYRRGNAWLSSCKSGQVPFQITAKKTSFWANGA
jgi:hypothetical protein